MSDLYRSLSDWGPLISGKWKLEILSALSRGPARWSQLTHGFPDAAPNVLTRQLRKLEQDGMILRQVIGERPPQVVEYRLTPKSEAMLPFLEALEAWDQAYGREVSA